MIGDTPASNSAHGEKEGKPLLGILLAPGEKEGKHHLGILLAAGEKGKPLQGILLAHPIKAVHAPFTTQRAC